MMPSEIAKISSQVQQQPVTRASELQGRPATQASETAQAAASVARVNKLQQGQETAAKSGQVLPPEEQQSSSRDQDRQTVQAAVSNIEDYVQSISRDLKFSVDDDSGRVVVKVLDSETQEVIRQIPSEEALDMARKLQEGTGEESGGLLFQDNA